MLIDLLYITVYLFLFRAMPCNPKQSLVLFDWDGYTAILNSSRIQRTGRLGGPLFVSCRGTLSYDGRLHKVEVLQLSGKFCFDQFWMHVYLIILYASRCIWKDVFMLSVHFIHLFISFPILSRFVYCVTCILFQRAIF